MVETPYGECHCGCGETTKIATRTHSKRGHQIGEPQPFLMGHGAAKKRHRVTQPNDSAVKHIAITKGQTSIVDVEDYERLNQYHWCAVWSESTQSFYAVRKVREEGVNRCISMHRDVMKYYGPLQVDHIHGDTLDNRKSRLRVATSSQNNVNAKLSVVNTSGYRGVYFSKSTGKWEANIGMNKVRVHIGVFPTPEEAYAAYLARAKEMHGDFAKVLPTVDKQLEMYGTS